MTLRGHKAKFHHNSVKNPTLGVSTTILLLQVNAAFSNNWCCFSKGYILTILVLI